MVPRGKRFAVVLSVAAVLIVATAASAQVVDDSFNSDIEKLLEVMGSKQLGAQMGSIIGKSILDNMRRTNTDIPARAIQVMQEVVDAEFGKAFTGPDSMMPGMVAVYAKHFTHAEIRDLLAFYGTDVGKKLISVLPAVTQEGAAVGQAWAVRHTPQVVAELQRRLRAEGLIK